MPKDKKQVFMNRPVSSISIVFITLAIIFSYNRCATVGNISGGDMDSIPPVLVFADPEMYSVNFDAKRVTMGFDEYVQVKNIQKELVISPPTEDLPEVWMKKKGFYFEVDRDELKDSSTYIYNFGNAVSDNNEGNVLVNFVYVFSTGPTIDSFGISGTILDAYTLKPPEESVTVMLHENLADSVPYKEKPLYVGKSLKDGSYNIEYVKPGTYRLFALKDANSNLIYDNPKELIAFSDSLITFDPNMFDHSKYHKAFVNDTSLSDSLVLVHDTILYDTLPNDTISAEMMDTSALADSVSDETIRIYGFRHDLSLFKEEVIDTLQRLESSGYVDDRMLYFSFNRPVTDSFEFRLQYYPDSEESLVREFSPDNDSLNFWITDTALLSKDTLNVILRFYRPDSMFVPFLSEDTFLFRVKRKPVKQKEKRGLFGQEEEKEEDGKVYIQPEFSIGNNKKAELNDTLFFNTKAPIKTINTSKILFQHLEDTVWEDTPVEIIRDSVWLNEARFAFDMDEDERYRFTFFDSALIDIYGVANDTAVLNFSTKRLDQYGTLEVDMMGVEGQVILLLQDNKGNIYRKKILDENQKVLFDYLIPREYLLKVIYDRNANGRWDPGRYLENRLPEKVVFYEPVINIRENWDHSEEWDISTND